MNHLQAQIAPAPSHANFSRIRVGATSKLQLWYVRLCSRSSAVAVRVTASGRRTRGVGEGSVPRSERLARAVAVCARGSMRV